MTTTFVGLDLGKTKGAVCVLNAQGEVVKRFPFPISRESLLNLSREMGVEASVALEVSTNSYAVSQILLEQGHSVSVSNPLLTKAIASSKVKNDAVDAKILAELLRCDYLPTVWIPDRHTQELRYLVSHRSLLQKIGTQLKNKIHSILHRNLIAVPKKINFSTLEGKRWIELLELSNLEKVQIATSLELLISMETQKMQVEQELAKQAYQEKAVSLLLTIPGVDYLTAITLLSAIGEIARFKTPKKLARYFGLVPSLYESGKTSYKGSITKQGNGLVRQMLIQCANASIKVEHPLRNFYERLRAKRGHPIAITAIARKLVVIVWHMLTKQKPYAFNKPKLTDRKLTKLHFLATGEKLKRSNQQETTQRRRPPAPKIKQTKEARLKGNRQKT